MVWKWEELEIKLGKEHNDDGVVNKIWCVVCKEIGTDSSFTVSIVNLNTPYLFWYRKLILKLFLVCYRMHNVNFCCSYNNKSVIFIVHFFPL